MPDSLFDAFAGKHFDPIFALTAATSNAHDTLAFDVAALHANAKTAIEDVTNAAMQGLDTTLRTVLLQAPSGYGKTHRLVTTLLQLVQQGRAYPVVMQLSAKVDADSLSRWMLGNVLDELTTRHFRDVQGRTSLRVMADRLWDSVPTELYAAFQHAEANEDLEAAAQVIKKAASKIRRDHPDTFKRHDTTLLSAVFLHAADVCDEVDIWFRTGRAVTVSGGIELPDLSSEMDYQDLISGFARIAYLTGSPLVIAIDQIETIVHIADSRLLPAIVTTAVQLVESTPKGLAVLISALADTYGSIIRRQIPDSFKQRIEFGAKPVTLKPTDAQMIRLLINRRIECLLEREGVSGDLADACAYMAPDWLLQYREAQSLRELFEIIREYRDYCKAEQRFLTQDEYEKALENAPSLPVERDDFDKLWADECDQDRGSERVFNLSDHDQQELLVWLATHVADEIPHVDAIQAETFGLQDDFATRIIDLHFQQPPGQTVERWKIALANAPNQKNRLLKQIEGILEAATDAKPAVVRREKMPGINEDGRPAKRLSDLRKVQAGPALVDLLVSGGRVVAASAKHWQRLYLARRFFEQRRDAAGFLNWCQQRRFLLEHADIGPLSRLVQPEGQGLSSGSTACPQTKTNQTKTKTPHLQNNLDLFNSDDTSQPSPQATPIPADSPSPASSAPAVVAADTMNADPRDHAMILLGHDAQQNPLYWALDRDAQPALPNFGLLVSGDAGQGKTQLIKAVVAEAVRLGCPVLIFDFKNDYADSPDDPFARDNGLSVIDLNEGLPFNPLKLRPQGSSGSQAIDHVYEVAGILEVTLGLGDQQKAILRDALEIAFERLDVPLREWVDSATVPAPSLASVIAIAQQIDGNKSVGLVNRMGLLHGKRLLPADADARLSFEALMQGRFVLSFSKLPNDDQLKRALAELILMQLQGYMLSGEQPRALRRLLVFDEAWRAADSQRLVQIAREGRAFGVGVVAGTQFAGDLHNELTGNLASKLHLFNSDANQHRKVVSAIFGGQSGVEPERMKAHLRHLKKFEAVFVNQQHTPYQVLTVLPYHKRRITKA